MAWSVFIQHMPASAMRVADIPEDFQPLPLGRRNDVVEAIATVFPTLHATDPTFFTVDDAAFHVDVAVVGDDPIETVTLHVRGDQTVIPYIARLIDLLGARAIDSWTGEFFDAETAVESVQRWRQYVDQS